ncbi:TERB2 protein, partial [Centropus unirufus]|nr:TERB2 protein [Centropus unirufus]
VGMGMHWMGAPGHPPPPPVPAAAGGGVLAPPPHAEFLFSSDAAHPDTRRIHESQDYLEGRATVFHSQYLTAWVNSGTGNKASVALGHFILPPACLQEGPGKQSIGVWLPGVPMGAAPFGGAGKDGPSVLCYIYYHRMVQARRDLKTHPEETGSGAPTQQEFPNQALQEYPVNNMVTGYASARDMKKYVGELHEFIPGTSGYAVHWIQDEINRYSDGKTKTKRKL